MHRVLGDERPHGGEAVAPVLEELVPERGYGFPIAVTEVEAHTGEQGGHEGRGRDLLVDFRVSLAFSHKRHSFLTLASRQGAGERDGDGGAGGRRGALRETLVAPEAEIVLGSDAVGVAGAGAVVALKRRRLPAHGDAVRADDALAARFYLVEQASEVGGGGARCGGARRVEKGLEVPDRPLLQRAPVAQVAEAGVSCKALLMQLCLATA